MGQGVQVQAGKCREVEREALGSGMGECLEGGGGEGAGRTDKGKVYAPVQHKMHAKKHALNLCVSPNRMRGRR